jgi:hypothetical protein
MPSHKVYARRGGLLARGTGKTRLHRKDVARPRVPCSHLLFSYREGIITLYEGSCPVAIPERTQHDLDAGGLPASGDTAPRPMSVADDESIVRESLLSWQCNGRIAAFERLVGVARDPVADIAARILRRSGVRDPAAVEDAVALVLDHLRRLPGVAFGERSVAPFEPVRAQSRPGLAYLTRLAVDRARDVVRQRRRYARRCIKCRGSSLSWTTPRPATHRITTSERGCTVRSRHCHRGNGRSWDTCSKAALRRPSRPACASARAPSRGSAAAPSTGCERCSPTDVRGDPAGVTRRRRCGRRAGRRGPPARAARPGRARASRRRGPPAPCVPACRCGPQRSRPGR